MMIRIPRCALEAHRFASRDKERADLMSMRFDIEPPHCRCVATSGHVACRVTWEDAEAGATEPASFMIPASSAALLTMAAKSEERAYYDSDARTIVCGCISVETEPQQQLEFQAISNALEAERFAVERIDFMPKLLKIVACYMAAAGLGERMPLEFSGVHAPAVVRLRAPDDGADVQIIIMPMSQPDGVGS